MCPPPPRFLDHKKPGWNRIKVLIPAKRAFLKIPARLKNMEFSTNARFDQFVRNMQSEVT